jgi:hypothetical protein
MTSSTWAVFCARADHGNSFCEGVHPWRAPHSITYHWQLLLLPMAEDDELDTNVLISSKLLSEEFSCPICFNPIKDAHMTPCGHDFCKTCILECLNRKHQCPLCNHAAVKENLIKNHHLDKICGSTFVLIGLPQPTAHTY